MVTAFFTALYVMIPNTRVHWRSALTGAAVAGVLWAAIGKLFTAFVVFSTRLTIVYAGFAFVVAALLWTYFGWLILLAGAQLSFYVQNPAYLRLGLQQLRLSSVELEQLALKLMYLVGRTHVGRRAALDGKPSGHRARTSGNRRGADGRDARARQPGRGHRVRTSCCPRATSVASASTRSWTSRAARPAATSRHGTSRCPRWTACSRSIEEARRHRCGDLTLRDLVDEAPRPTLTVARGGGS